MKESIMTVKGLWNYYKTKVGYKIVALSTFKGGRIAVDVFGIMYETRAVAKSIYLRKINPFLTKVDDKEIDKIWVSKFMETIIEYMICGVTPVLVFDSPTNDPLKINTLEERTAYSKGYEDKIKILMDTYKDSAETAPVQAIAAMREHLGRINLVPHNSIVLAKDMCKNLGIPYVYSTGEGERTCSLMNNQGVCNAVITSDSDAMFCGAKIVLKEKTRVRVGVSEELGYHTANIDDMLSSLKMEFCEFQDLCIMSGTDFNKNVKNISWVRAHALLKKHKTVAKIGESIDIACINYDEVKCRVDLIPWEDTASESRLSFSVPDDGMFAMYNVEHLAERFARVRKNCVCA